MYPYASVVTLAAAVLFNFLAFQVGKARVKHGVPAPGADGPPEFMRRYRTHMNTVEQAIVFLPVLWLCAIWVGDVWAGLGGAAWLAGRILYARGYYEDPKKRGAGFVIALAATAAMGLAAACSMVIFLFAGY
ncbi:MAG: MAPEG family protein [Tagaea sp.]